MSYRCQYLQFGDNQKRVPGYEEDLILSNMPNAPIPKKLVDPVTDTLWGLVFSFESGEFYLSGANVPGQGGAIIKSWYATGGNGAHYLALTPFIVGEGEGGFVQAAKFVDFSETPTTDNSINTDTIKNPTVTATVHPELPEYEKMEVSTKTTSHSVIITTKTTHVVFDRIFVYAGGSMPIDNALTVPKGQSCFALAVFKKVESSSSNEIGTFQWPKIPKWEWPMIVAEIIKEIVVKGNGEIFEHISPKLIAEAEPEVLKRAIVSIGKRIDELDKIKSVLAGLSERKPR